MAKTIATCRYCGAQGIEDETDPAPGICPSCLLNLLEANFEELSSTRTVEELRAVYIALGLTPEWAGFYAGLEASRFDA